MHCSEANRILSICNHMEKGPLPNGCYPSNRFANYTKNLPSHAAGFTHNCITGIAHIAILTDREEKCGEMLEKELILCYTSKCHTIE